VKVALVEDELPALEHLERLLARVSPCAVVVARLRTVRQLRVWLADDGDANLVLADVQLGDGLSIDAFAGSARALPVVFVTAHDHFLTEALAADGIAYLLKPLREADLALALAKLARLERHFARTLGEVAAALSPATDRLVGRRGLDWVSVPVADVLVVRVRHEATYAVGRDGREVLLDGSLASVAARLEPRRFHRANRWTLVAVDAIARVRAAGKGRLELVLVDGTEVAVPQEGAAAFRAWFGC
jgi:DNA-binding LytR/AlgR family response regulator